VSEDRIYDLSVTLTVAREQGKLKSKFSTTRFQIYNAGQFKQRLDGKNFNRKIPSLKSERESWYLTMFRVRIDGRWHNPSGCRYEFFTIDQFFLIMKGWHKLLTPPPVS